MPLTQASDVVFQTAVLPQRDISDHFILVFFLPQSHLGLFIACRVISSNEAAASVVFTTMAKTK